MAEANRRRTPTAFQVTTIVTCVAVTLFVFAVIARGATINDDIGNLRFAAEKGLTLEYLLQPVFDHFAPGHRFLSWVQLQMGPRNFAMAYGMVSGFVGVSFLLLTSIMARLGGKRLWIPLLAVLPFVSIFGIDVATWFASAHHQLPAIMFGLLAIRLYIAHRDHGRPLLLVLSACSVVLGMAFVAKALLAVGVIVLLEHLVFRQDRLSGVPRAMVANWPTWAVYAIPTLIYIALTGQTIDERPVASFGSVVASIRVGWLVRFAPSLFGLDPETDGYSALEPDTLAVVIGVQAALAVLVLWLIRRRQGAGRGLLLLVAVFVVNAVMTLATRVTIFGPGVAVGTLRYWLEPFLYTVMLVPWLVTRPPVREDGRRSSLRQRVVPGVAAVAVVGIVGMSVRSSIDMHNASLAVQARAWYDAADASLARFDPPTSIIDDNIAAVIIPTSGRWRVLDLAMQFPQVTIDGDPRGHVFTTDGTVEPASFEWWYDESGRGFAASPLVVTMGETETRDESVCTSTSMTFDLLLADPDDKRYLAFTLDGAATLEFRWLAEPYPRPEEPQQTWTTSADQRAVAMPIDLVDADAYATTIVPHDGAEVCVERVRIGYMANDTPLRWEPQAD